MRYIVIADIHSNLMAFKAVLSDAEKRGHIDQIWCLGDIVGYGPDPSECINLLCKYEHLCVAGNHDLAAVGIIDLTGFNQVAAEACRWTSRQLSPDDVEYLRKLPYSITCNDFTLVHGSPRKPIDEYILSKRVAKENLPFFNTKYCIVGHSHIPLLFEYNEIDDDCLMLDMPYEIPFKLSEHRLIINPGSVGQPRQGNPRASYMIIDSNDNTARNFHISYDIEVTQRKMIENGISYILAERLTYGF